MGIIKTVHPKDKNKPTRFFSDKQEKSIVKAIGGKQTKNSGATLHEKGDVIFADWIFEAKTKTKDSDSITVKKEWFDQNLKESYRMSKEHSAVVISFGPGQTNYYIIDENTFKELLDNNS